MRVAILTELFYPHIAGCERRYFEIGKRLVKRGHEVHVFTMRHEKKLPKDDRVEGVFVHRYAHSKNYITLNHFRSMEGVLKYSFSTIFRLISKKDFDIYYFNQWPIAHSIFVGPLLSPAIQEWCEVWLDKIVTLERIVSKVISYSVAVSDFTKRRLMNFLHVPPEKIMIIPNGVDYSKFSKSSHEKKWGRIVYLGRLVPHKHLDLLLEAFRQVKQNMPEAELHIIGSGPLLPSIREQAFKLDDCFIHGFLPEEQMLDILRSSWLFVLPSEREGSGIAALEAMAAGSPVITVDYPDNATKELITKRGTGMVAQPEKSSIASKIMEIYSDEDNWQKMSVNARSLAMTYDWDRVVDSFESYLQRVANNSF